MNFHTGHWLNSPEQINFDGTHLRITAKDKSDFWRETSYGFIHNSGHALLNDFPGNSAVEASWILNYSEQFDQAGLIAWADDEHWIKAGIEYADGAPQLGAVVTSMKSDWSVAPVPNWMNQEVSIRFSRTEDALTIRAKCHDDWQLVRLLPIDKRFDWKVGIHCASPTRSGLEVTFTSLKHTKADLQLH